MEKDEVWPSRPARGKARHRLEKPRRPLPILSEGRRQPFGYMDSIYSNQQGPVNVKYTKNWMSTVEFWLCSSSLISDTSVTIGDFLKTKYSVFLV
ncbi:hypothetical protein chiPu_0002881 [Chiloscyllium punctatum]|uniref:Uncharacterized protein n=1 Tax=Chiloscyllium punctatum TaxID=137246 RepID=A0A401S289_CHIPU|nr:hypothetical protein [Chiloscyllium punctatum]